jgi:hypothetical protein
VVPTLVAGIVAGLLIVIFILQVLVIKQNG